MRHRQKGKRGYWVLLGDLLIHERENVERKSFPQVERGKNLRERGESEEGKKRP